MSKLRGSKFVSIVAASISATLGVAFLTFAATTISTSITTGGTLDVSGATTLNGAVTLGDAIGDAVTVTGNATTTNSLYVTNILTVGGNATTTSSGALALASGLGLGANNTVAKTLLFSGLSSDPSSATAGLVYYNTGSAVLRMADGTNWFTVGTSTSGLTLSGNRLQLGDLNYYVTFGTTSQQGLSMLTLEATGTAAIPLTLVTRNSQTSNALQVRNSASANLLTVSELGGLYSSSSVQASSASRFYDALTVDGATTLSGTLGVTSGVTTLSNSTTTGASLTQNLIVGGFASTTGNVMTWSKFGVATDTPAAEFSASGTATTTMYLHSVTANTGGCLELRGSDGTAYRMYISGSDTSTTTTNGRTAVVALWEAGACK